MKKLAVFLMLGFIVLFAMPAMAEDQYEQFLFDTKPITAPEVGIGPLAVVPLDKAFVTFGASSKRTFMNGEAEQNKAVAIISPAIIWNDFKFRLEADVPVSEAKNTSVFYNVDWAKKFFKDKLTISTSVGYMDLPKAFKGRHGDKLQFTAGGKFLLYKAQGNALQLIVNGQLLVATSGSDRTTIAGVGIQHDLKFNDGLSFSHVPAFLWEDGKKGPTGSSFRYDARLSYLLSKDANKNNFTFDPGLSVIVPMSVEGRSNAVVAKAMVTYHMK